MWAPEYSPVCNHLIDVGILGATFVPLVFRIRNNGNLSTAPDSDTSQNILVSEPNGKVSTTTTIGGKLLP